MFWSCSLSGLASVVPVILLSLDQSAVLHALSALVGGCGRGIGGKNNEAADCGPGEKGAQEMLAAGDYVFGEAPTQVSVGGRRRGFSQGGRCCDDRQSVLLSRGKAGFFYHRPTGFHFVPFWGVGSRRGKVGAVFGHGISRASVAGWTWLPSRMGYGA